MAGTSVSSFLIWQAEGAALRRKLAFDAHVLGLQTLWRELRKADMKKPRKLTIRRRTTVGGAEVGTLAVDALWALCDQY